MIRSMTGFGRASRAHDDLLIVIEANSVNHRFLDTHVRVPNEWASLEPSLRDAIKNRIGRGKVNVFLTRKRQPGAAARLRLDKAAAQEYVDAARSLADLLQTSEQLSVNTLAQFDGVFVEEEEEADLDALGPVLLGALGETLDELDKMRVQEGNQLYHDIVYRIGLIREGVEEIDGRIPELSELYTQKLRDRIQEIATDSAYTEDRMALEIGLMAERGDVTEEIVRLRSHLDHALDLLDKDEPVGRELNFLSQEIQREINTLGAKVRDTEVVRHVLSMKSELEKIREQVQNVE